MQAENLINIARALNVSIDELFSEDYDLDSRGYNSFREGFIMTNKIRECRKRKGLSQEELANKIGVKRAVVSKYETGKISPRIEIIQKISRVLGVPVHELVGDTMYIDTVENISALLNSREATPADVSPVVRCKDCKYWHRALLKSEDGSPVDFGICDFMKDDVDTDEKDFCSLGERIDKNE